MTPWADRLQSGSRKKGALSRPAPSTVGRSEEVLVLERVEPRSDALTALTGNFVEVGNGAFGTSPVTVSISNIPAASIAIDPGVRLVVTEGNYLLVDDGPWSAVRWLLDEVWVVQVDADLRLERLVARHVEFGKPPDVAAAWVASVDVPNADFVRSTFGRADLVIDGT